MARQASGHLTDEHEESDRKQLLQKFHRWKIRFWFSMTE
jgi:hypothetical protein